jgi:phytoene dehydrogenase-like protein
MKGRVVVIGGGINGLVAANYLQRDGYDVKLLEKKDVVGGACAVDTVTFDGVEYQYACGASVLGFMQDFVFAETGLADKLTVLTPEHPEVVYFEGEDTPCILWESAQERAREVRDKWGETGDIEGFTRDLERVVSFICDGFRRAEVPTVELANEALGREMTNLWITGTARSLLNTYFTSERMKLFYAIDVVESGPVSLDSPYSAFSIALMATGTVFDGEWGFVRGRIWQLTKELATLNKELGVEILTSVEVTEVGSDPLIVRFRQAADTTEHSMTADRVVFATDPINAARLNGQPSLIATAAEKQTLGSSGKLVMFFKKPVIWKGDYSQSRDFDMAFKFVMTAQTLDELEATSQAALTGSADYLPAFCEIYCEGAAMRSFGDDAGYDIVSVFVKHLSFDKPGSELESVRLEIENKILAFVENSHDMIGSVLLTPRDLQIRFDFPGGNIDHIELCDKQTYFARNWSPDPEASFYQFGTNANITYCAAGTYPCGSIAGTPGYMCAMQISMRHAVNPAVLPKSG